MALSPTDQARLDGLQAAYDRLISGAATASVQSSGRKVEYARGDVERLRSEISALSALAVSGSRTRGAVRFRL